MVKSGRVIHAGVIKRVTSRHAPRNPRNRLNDPLLQFLSLFPGLPEMLNSQVVQSFDCFETRRRIFSNVLMMKRMENLVFKSLFQHLSLRGLIGSVS